MASYQKGRLEKNHEYIRYVIPKGISFNKRNQDDMTLMINHINSAARDSLNGKTPFKLAQMLLDNSLLDKLSLEHIPADATCTFRKIKYQEFRTSITGT